MGLLDKNQFRKISAPESGERQRTLIFGGVGLLFVIAIVAGLGSLFGLGGPTSTTAADYTSAEVKEIINILRLDDETRHRNMACQALRYQELREHTFRV